MDEVLIDYAEVLSKPFPPGTMTELARLVNLEPSEFERRYWEYRPPYDQGQSSREYWDTVAGPGNDIDDAELAALVNIDVNGWLDLNPAAVRWLAELNRIGIKPWLLSNAPHPLADAIAGLPIASFFAGMIFSARIGVTKPSRECFAVAEQAMRTEAGRILFIDDRSANIAAAAGYGMNTFLFTGEFPVPAQR